VRIVIARLFTRDESVPLAVSGGVFRESPLVKDVFYNEVGARSPRVSMKDGVVEAVDGALGMARQTF
jgi:hypothetical protein